MTGSLPSTLLEHLIDSIDPFTVHPISMMSETSTKTNRNMQELMDERLLPILMAKTVEALRNDLNHVTRLSTECKLPQTWKSVNASQRSRRI